MTIRTEPQAEDLRAWMVCHVQALEAAGAAAWHVLRARMILEGFNAFTGYAAATPAPGGFVSFLAPAIGEALEREHRPDVDAIAAELVDDLLTCGHKPGATKGDHLRIMLDGRELAGWNETALLSRVRVAIRKAAAPPAVLEAIQDEEAILRLALAFKALAADTSSEGGPVYDLAWRLADYLENPAEAHDAITRGEARDRRRRVTR